MLGTRVFQAVVKSIAQTPVGIEETLAWTDTTKFLHWLSKEPSRWSSFLTKQIIKIQSESKFHWNHVCSEENPTDPASRKINPDQIIQHDL